MRSRCMSSPDFSGMLSANPLVNSLPKLVVVVGPSGAGKTKLSVEIARRFSGEIVNGDATALYRHLSIGSAKPTPLERREVPHHLIDVAAPDETITVAQYQQLAYRAIDDILSRGKCPLLVGGSGLYVRAVTEGYRIPLVPPNHQLRQTLTREAEERGHVWLHGLLRSLDPMAATCIDPTNVRRVIRAIEVCLATGQPISGFWKERDIRYASVIVGLTRPLEELFARIDLRVDHMLQEGLVDEVRSILDMGYAPDSSALSAIGYKEVIRYLQGKIALDVAVRQIKQATRRLARRQLRGWFRLDDAHIHWFDVDSPNAVCCIERLLASQGLGRHD